MSQHETHSTVAPSKRPSSRPQRRYRIWFYPEHLPNWQIRSSDTTLRFLTQPQGQNMVLIFLISLWISLPLLTNFINFFPLVGFFFSVPSHLFLFTFKLCPQIQIAITLTECWERLLLLLFPRSIWSTTTFLKMWLVLWMGVPKWQYYEFLSI